MRYHQLNHHFRVTLLVLIFFAAALFSTSLLAETEAQNQAIDKALIDALEHSVNGPAEVNLLDEATISLPKDVLFVPQKIAAPLMKSTGNETTNTFVGLIMPQDSAFHWFIAVDFVKSGYINDSAVTKWHADTILEHLQNTAEKSNETRNAQSFPTVKIQQWVQQPSYQTNKHILKWSVQGTDSEAYQFINDNTAVLGRYGYFTFTLLSKVDNIKQSKKETEQITASLQFSNGKTYNDYVEKTDIATPYDIEAIIIGEAEAIHAKWVLDITIAAAIILLAILTILTGVWIDKYKTKQ